MLRAVIKTKSPLSKMVQNYLCIPADPVERLFSIAGKIFRPERCRLADKHFQQLMFLRCNGRYMNYEDRKYLYLFESMPLNGSNYDRLQRVLDHFRQRGDFVFMTARNMGPGLVRAENISSCQ